MTHILVTNDDGINGPGLPALVRALADLGTVSVCVPEHDWSAGGHVKTLHKPLRAWASRLADGTAVTVSSGAPSDCVALAMLGLIPGKIDLVVSGINAGANLGYDLTYSGTVTAAMEAVINGAPAIAVSLCTPEPEKESDYSAAAGFALRAARNILEREFPAGILLNINVPCLPENKIRGVRITRQGLRVYRDELVTRMDPRGKPYYWIGGGPPSGVPEEDSDFGAISEGYVSVTPVQLDLTAYSTIEGLRGWDWSAG